MVLFFVFFTGATSTWLYFVIGGIIILLVLVGVIVTIRGRHHCSERRLGQALARPTHVSININCVSDSEDDEQEFQWDDNDLASGGRSARTLTSTTYVSNSEQIPMATLSTQPETGAQTEVKAEVQVHSEEGTSAASTSASAIISTTASKMTKSDVEPPASEAEASSELAREAVLALDVAATAEGAEGGEGEIVPLSEFESETSSPSEKSSAKNTSSETSPMISERDIEEGLVARCDAKARSITPHEMGACNT